MKRKFLNLLLILTIILSGFFFDVKPVNADFEDINKETHMPIKIVD